jgi:UDPglucose 6-dehydrogenase
MTPRAWRTRPRSCPSITEAVVGADLVCVLTGWEEFRYADPNLLGGLVNGRRVIDGLNCLDQALWTASGWEYRGMGRPTVIAPQ